jgi:hypothetical protein
MTVHSDQYWTAGDDWLINATLIDENGEPYDLSGTPVIKWALVNANGVTALDQDDATIFIVDALGGRCSIQVAAAKTSPLPGGNYLDSIRLVFNGTTSTLSYGNIFVAADPWAAATATASQLKLVS